MLSFIALFGVQMVPALWRLAQTWWALRGEWE